MVGASALVAILACVATKVVVAADRKDLSREAAERNGRCDDARAAGRHSWRDHAERSEELLVPVTTTGHPADVSGVDFVIEAADNSVPVKRSVVQECQRERGLAGIIFQADQLSDHYGERFRPPASLVARAATGELYE